MSRSELHPGRALLLVGVLAGGLFFWDSPVLLPFKLLSVMGHETGHAVASLLAGGSVDSVTLRPNESGQCLSKIPESFFAKVLVYSGGYVGSAIIAVALLVLTYRFNARRKMLAAACGWLVLMGIFYARDAFTFAFCVVMGALFAAAAKWLPDELAGVLNLFIAGFTALYALVDLKDDLWNRAVRSQSDAQLLADVTIVPAIVWATVWTLVSVAVVLFGAWVALRDKPRPVSGATAPSVLPKGTA
ncbi:MAG: M50 family metallopeptidase [Myxococcota bacterium]